MAVTIREVSRKCGLSISSVSKALNNYPDVREETRLRVLRVAREIGYYPNALARGLKTNRTFNLGVVLDDEMRDSLLHTFFVVILNGFRREAEKNGYDITLINRNFRDRRMSFLAHCRNRNLDGVCLMCVDFNDPQVKELLSGEVACVTIDHPFENRDCVMGDSRGGIRALVAHAVELGHTRIAYVHGSPSYVTDVRVDAFKEAAMEFGLHIPNEYTEPAHYHSPAHTGEAVRRLAALGERPTCIMMPDDYSALGGIEAARSLGLRIPQDLSMMGYDGTDMIQRIHPRLTTVSQHGNEIGERAARMLIRRMDSPDLAASAPDIVPITLIAGETVARIER